MPEHELQQRVMTLERRLRNVRMAMIVIDQLSVDARGVEVYDRRGDVVGRLP